MPFWHDVASNSIIAASRWRVVFIGLLFWRVQRYDFYFPDFDIKKFKNHNMLLQSNM